MDEVREVVTGVFEREMTGEQFPERIVEQVEATGRPIITYINIQHAPANDEDIRHGRRPRKSR